VLVTGAVLASAVLHACWNALAHRAGDALAAVALVMVGLAGVSLPLVFFVAAPAAASWPFLAVSLVLHVTYTVLLARCYSIGDFGQVYPLARGSAPLVVALLAVVLVGERLSWVALAGVGAVCGGLWVLVGGAGQQGAGPQGAGQQGAGQQGAGLRGAGLRGFGLRGRVHNPRAVLVAAATGLAIAGYTTVDGVGVRRAGSTLGYTVWLLGALGVAMLAYAAWQYGRSLVASMRRMWWLVAVGGTLGWASYALVLWAQTRGALAAVAALRETSVVVAAVLGTLFFGERFGRRRIVATLLVAAGIVLLNL